MAVVMDVSTKTVEDFLEKLGCGADTEEGRQLLEAIRTDGWRSYPKAAKNKEIEHCKVVCASQKMWPPFCRGCIESFPMPRL